MKTSELYLDEHEVCASLCEDSYFEFFKEFNGIFIEEEVIYNWHVKYLCDVLQAAAERLMQGLPKKADIIVNIPPGMTKSSIFSIAFAPWMWTRMPRFKMICVTHTDDLGKELSMKARDIVLSEKYRKCWPHLALRADRNNIDKWNNNHGGWRMASTVAGRSPMGFHAHWIDVDDPINPENVKSRAKIAQATDYCRRTLPSRKVNKKTTVTAYVMQRLDIDDPCGDRLRNKEAGPVDHYCLPCDDTWDIYPPELKKKYKRRNGLLDPSRLPRKAIRAARGELGAAGHAGQFGQSPVPKGGIVFDVTQFESRMKKHAPKDSEFRRIVRYWDKAYTQDGGAYTAGVKIGVIGSGEDQQFWVLDVVRIQEESSRREKQMRMTAEMDGRHIKIYIEQEPAAGKESVRNSIRNLAGFSVRADRRGGANDLNKVMRADPFADQVNSGNVWIKLGPWNEAYIQELRYFSEKAKYKDQVDASSGAFDVITRIRTIGAAV